MIKEAIFVIVFSLYGSPVDFVDLKDYYGSIRIETVVPSMAICQQMKANHSITRDYVMEEANTIENAQINLFCNSK